MVRRRFLRKGLPSQKPFARPGRMPGKAVGQPVRKMPVAVQAARMQAMARPSIARGSSLQQRHVMERKTWARIPLIGGLIELLRSIVFRGDRFRVYKKAPLGSKTRSILTVKMDMIRRKPERMTRRQLAQMLRDRAPQTTAVKGHQFARTGRVPGVLKHPALKKKAG